MNHQELIWWPINEYIITNWDYFYETINYYIFMKEYFYFPKNSQGNPRELSMIFIEVNWMFPPSTEELNSWSSLSLAVSRDTFVPHQQI